MRKERGKMMNTAEESDEIEDRFENIIECNSCQNYKDKDQQCRHCYFNNAPQDTWIKVKKDLDLPSFQDVIIYTDYHDTSILIASFCDSERSHCRKWHITTIDSCGMGEKRFVEMPFSRVKFWRKLPSIPGE